MKKIIISILVLASLVAVLTACGGQATTTTKDNGGTTLSTTTGSVTTTTPNTTEPDDGTLSIISGGVAKYSVVYPSGALSNDEMKSAIVALRTALKSYSSEISISDDYVSRDDEATFVAPEYEILIGNTNRAESSSLGELLFNEARITVVGKKVVITGGDNTVVAQAVMKFIEKYLVEGEDTLTLSKDINDTVYLDLKYCVSENKTYLEMAHEVLDSFNEEYWQNYWIKGCDNFWPAAEMLETIIDAYEATKDKDIETQMLRFADQFMRKYSGSWQWNMYNDDIMWICIAYSRITLLTGKTKYYTKAKSEFDQVWARAYDKKLDGGLYWTTDNTTKNSCVNCPAAIAACLIGEISKDESYFEKAKELIEWEVKYMYEVSTGKVYDSYNLTGNKNKWASTYNQGTFIGANYLLYKHYKDETYLTYADKAADYAMKKLTSGGILDNGEAPTDNGDLPGFKAILTRWMYRYAKETNDIDILYFLQSNAKTAYSNRNSDGLIWTAWKDKTSDDVSSYNVFGMSTAVALMFNCHQWWE